MIDPHATVSYSQYNEDIILDALLYDIEGGFYIDIGANYPVVDSVTKRFYDRGWSGINIEPLRLLYKQLNIARKRDINLCCGISDKNGTASFREFPELPGHSTFAEAQKDENLQISSREYQVPTIRLEDIFNDYCKGKKVNFIKIDVEGFEDQVVRGNNWAVNRPEVICIEANHAKNAWKRILVKNSYRLFVSDGLNEYYIAEESWARTEGFEERSVKISYHSLRQHQFQSWSDDSKKLKKYTQQAENYEALIHTLKEKISELEKEYSSVYSKTFAEKSMSQRLKIAAAGLTVDWFRYKRERR